MFLIKLLFYWNWVDINSERLNSINLVAMELLTVNIARTDYKKKYFEYVLILNDFHLLSTGGIRL